MTVIFIKAFTVITHATQCIAMCVKYGIVVFSVPIHFSVPLLKSIFNMINFNKK